MPLFVMGGFRWKSEDLLRLLPRDLRRGENESRKGKSLQFEKDKEEDGGVAKGNNE